TTVSHSIIWSTTPVSEVDVDLDGLGQARHRQAGCSGATGFRQPFRQLANDLMDFGVAQCSGRYARPDTRLDERRISGSRALILLLFPNSLFITDGAST